MNIMTESILGIIGLILAITISAISIFNDYLPAKILAPILAFIVGSYISELGAKGKRLGIIR